MTGTGTVTEESRRSHRLYIFWTAALVLLAGGALLCQGIAVPYLRARAKVALYRQRREDRSGARRPAELVEKQVVRDLGGEEQAARGLALYLKFPRRLSPDREDAVALLGYCGPAGLRSLTSLLGDGDPAIRRAAARSLGKLGDGRAVEPLLETLSDEDCGVKIEAARALAAVGDRRAVPALIAALRDESSVVRTEAAAALGAVGDARAAPALVRALKDKYWTVRRAAVRSLGATGGPQVLPSLLRAATEDPDYHVREATAEAFKQLGDRGVEVPRGRGKADPGPP